MNEIKYSFENNDEVYMKLKINKQYYTIRGYSRAGLKTSILIDEFNVVFDYGYSNDRAFSYDNKIISHGHADHIGSLHMDHCARHLMNVTKERLYIMPQQCVLPFKMMATATSEMNCGKKGYDIKIFDDLLLTKLIYSEECIHKYINLVNQSEYYVKAFEMTHKIKSYGYIIYRKSQKIKLEYLSLDVKSKITLKEENKLCYDVYTPLLGYTGDTTIEGVINNSEFLNVPLLIMECTGFTDDLKEYTKKGKHIHFDDIKDNYHLFKNDKILLFHFSQQYKTIDEIRKHINYEKYNNIEIFF